MKPDNLGHKSKKGTTMEVEGKGKGGGRRENKKDF
jgi:hypothetical protein